jgi:hypothetical protein
VNDAEFGEPCGNSRWFNREPNITRIDVKTFRELWPCPCDCDGQMIFNGQVWSTNPPGYHHTCSRCGFTAAVHTKYPRITHGDADD